MSYAWHVPDAEDETSELLSTTSSCHSPASERNDFAANPPASFGRLSQPEKTKALNIKELLLAPDARVEQLTPPRPNGQYRPSPVME